MKSRDFPFNVVAVFATEYLNGPQGTAGRLGESSAAQAVPVGGGAGSSRKRADRCRINELRSAE